MLDFRPPKLNPLIVRLTKALTPPIIKKHQKVSEISVDDKSRQILSSVRNESAVLVPNHSDYADAFVMFLLSREIDATFKTAYNANGRTYIGNIKQGGRLYPDRMIKSPRLRPDIFPEDNFMTLEANDGDEIIHLTGFGDRVFIFKKRKLYILLKYKNL